MDKDHVITSHSSQADHSYIAINYVFNIISIFSSSLILFTIIALRIKQVNFSDRISLRLVLYISIIEIFFSIFHMLRITPYFPTWISYASTWGYIFSTLLICFFTLAIVINTQLIFIHNYKDNAHMNKFYLIISISLAIILSGLPITFSELAFDQERRYFWFSTPIMEWYTYQGWIIFTVSYCLISLIFVKYRLRKQKKSLSKSQISTDSDSTHSATSTMVSATVLKQQIQSKFFPKYVSRIMLYSLIPILSYFPTIIIYLIHLHTKDNFFILNLFSLIFASSQSIFTFTIFMFDPVLDEAILEHERNMQLRQTIVDKIHKGIYVNNIYNIDLELPSQKHSNNNNNNNNNNNKRRTIYDYARSTKNRISGITSVISIKKKSMDVKKDIFNLDNEEDDVLHFL